MNIYLLVIEVLLTANPPPITLSCRMEYNNERYIRNYHCYIKCFYNKDATTLEYYRCTTKFTNIWKRLSPSKNQIRLLSENIISENTFYILQYLMQAPLVLYWIIVKNRQCQTVLTVFNFSPTITISFFEGHE